MNVFWICVIVIVSIVVFTAIYLLFSSEIKYLTTLKRNCLVAKFISKYTLSHTARYKIDLDWWKDKDCKTLNIKSFDNLNLYAYFLKRKTNKIAIVVHGYGATAFEMQQYCKMFYDEDISVLAVDNRAHGKSEGKTITMGYYDYKDIDSWVKYLIKLYPRTKIILFGLSMGAGTVCMYSGISKPNNVKAIISDCAYSSAYGVFNKIAKETVVLSIFPTLKVFDKYLKLRIGFKLSQVEPKNYVKKCDVPILYIHGNKDSFVPFYMQDDLYNNTRKKYRHKLIIDGACHAESIVKDYEKYKKSVFKFLDDCLKSKNI